MLSGNVNNGDGSITLPDGAVELIEPQCTLFKENSGQDNVDLCSYRLPDLPWSDIPLSEISVIYYPGEGDAPRDLYQTTDTTVPCALGWKFVDATKAPTIEFRTTTCALIQADERARVEIDIGCIEFGPG